ncbi:MAG: HAD-IC family P-type ATPase, partial [Candidatus Competibacteraceae bacterium]|nr:HAD-IC family P-type ATPase [Candidatus Competibacteraceae bacterium]
MAAAEQPAYEPHRLIPVHTVVPGRARFKTQALYRRDSLKSQLERRLSQLDGVRPVGINVLTCTVLVHYDPAQSHSQIQRVLEGELEELPAVAARPQRRGSLLQRFKAPTQPPDESKARESSTSERDKSPPAARLDHQGQQHRNRQGEPWHTLEPQALARRLEVDPRQGLTRREAETRLARYGANVLPRPEGRSRLSLLLQQFASPPVLLLGASAVVSVATSGLVEAVSILGVVVINAVIGYYTERQSERIISALNPQVSHEVRVLRDGRLTRLPSERLVVGDVLEFNAGAYIPADTRLIEAQRLSIDESALTGESVPVDKRADTTLEEDIPLGERINMAYTGTVVAGGRGRALVVGTGLNSEIGRIQTLAAGARPPATPMETQLEQLGTRLVWLSSGICLAVFAVGLLRGYGWLPMLESAITLAVAAVPEGLPMVATTTLALGIREMRRHQVLVRQLSAVETLGSVEVFCFDKTGTLTLNRMTAVTLQLGLTPVRIEGEGMMAEDRPVALTDSEGGRRLCQVIALCS